MNAINIQPETAQKIAQMAAERHIEPETLVNEILAEYFASTPKPLAQNSAAFLLSIAGIFESEVSDTSEQTANLVRDFILNKYLKTQDDSLN